MSKPTPMSFDEAVRVLRGAGLVSIEPDDMIHGSLQTLWPADTPRHHSPEISIEVVTPDEARSIELALAIETISQSAEGENS